ncbi:MAG: hypothetical protein ABI165_05060, partial [Bryobacteraceae bacterium]
LLASALAVPLAAGNLGGRAEYVGGTRPDIPDGCGGSLQTIDTLYFVFYTKKASLRVPYDKINMIEYGQNVGRAYPLALAIVSPVFLLGKKHSHFLTVDYADEDGHQQALIFRVDKRDVRSILVSLEARTGLKIQYQDEEARKGGKG